MAEQDPGTGASYRNPFDPFALLDKSQRIALGVATEAFDALLAVGRTAAQPDEAVRQISALVGAIGDLASATAQPMQNFLTQQRELADTMANIARVQSELAGLIESVAVKHAAAVESLETLTAPVFGLVIKADKDSRGTKP